MQSLVPEMAFRRGQRRSVLRPRAAAKCACLATAATILMLLPQAAAVFTPSSKSSLMNAIGDCLDESADGDCTTFAGTDPGSNGAIGTWDVTAVTNMSLCECCCATCCTVGHRRNSSRAGGAQGRGGGKGGEWGMDSVPNPAMPSHFRGTSTCTVASPLPPAAAAAGDLKPILFPPPPPPRSLPT